MQGYNAQAVTNEHQVALAADIETVGADLGHLEPMLDVTQRELETAGIDEPPAMLLADPGYCHGEQMQRIGDHGIQVLIPPDTGRRRTTRRDAGTRVFFCDAHAHWQRGSNENTNGLLRDYFPKSTDLSVHTIEEIQRVAAEINHRPRKTLGWSRPADLFERALATAA